LLAQAVVLFNAAIAPDHIAGLRQRRDFGDPADQARVLNMGRHIQAQAFEHRSVHGGGSNHGDV
jgi:hypothetical protein